MSNVISKVDPNTIPSPLQIVNCFDEFTAHNVYQYPYCAGVVSQQQHWYETRKAYGQRHVYRTLNPYTGKWLAVKPSHYYDIVILLTCDDPINPLYNQVFPLTVMLDFFTNQELFDFAVKYSFDFHQRNVVMSELNKRGVLVPPPWKTEPQILYAVADRHANPLPPELRVQRLTNEFGIVCETFEAANARLRKERRAARDAEQSQKAKDQAATGEPKKGRLILAGEDVTDLSPAHLAIFKDLNGLS